MLYFNEKKNNIRHYIRTTIIILFIVISILSPKFTSAVSKTANYFIKPFAQVTSFISNSIETEIDSVMTTRSNLKELKDIRLENQSLKEDIRRLQNIINENEHLKNHSKLLDKTSGISANVILYNNDINFRKFLVDKGINDGVKVGDIVLSSLISTSNNESGALVGKVVEAGHTNSLVSSILDDSLGLSFVHSKSGINGIFESSSTKELRGFLLEKTDVKIGDLIFTSGLGGRFNKGLYIGRVKDSYQKEDDLNQILEVEVPVKFSKITRVIIVEGDK